MALRACGVHVLFVPTLGTQGSIAANRRSGTERRANKRIQAVPSLAACFHDPRRGTTWKQTRRIVTIAPKDSRISSKLGRCMHACARSLLTVRARDEALRAHERVIHRAPSCARWACVWHTLAFAASGWFGQRGRWLFCRPSLCRHAIRGEPLPARRTSTSCTPPVACFSRPTTQEPAGARSHFKIPQLSRPSVSWDVKATRTARGGGGG